MELARWSDRMLESATGHRFDEYATERIQQRHKVAIKHQNIAWLLLAMSPLAFFTGIVTLLSGGLFLFLFGLMQLTMASGLFLGSTRMYTRSTRQLNELHPHITTLAQANNTNLPRWTVEVVAADTDVRMSLLREPAPTHTHVWMGSNDPYHFNTHDAITREMHAAGYEPVDLHEQPASAVMVIASETISSTDEETVYSTVAEYRHNAEEANEFIRERMAAMVEAELLARSLQQRIM